MKTTTEEKRNRVQELSGLGFSINTLGAPRGEVDKHDREWPHIAFDVELKYKDKRVLLTAYRLGVGHVDPKKARIGNVISSPRLNSNEESLLLTWQSKSHAQFTNRQLWADVAAKLAAHQKVLPSLDNVVHSLLLDSDPYFNNESFEDWCGNFGYDTDSRRAEDI